MSEVRVADRFRSDLRSVESTQILDDILTTVELLAVVPSLGSAAVPESIVAEFGDGVRKIPVGPFDIITFYYPDRDMVEVAALIHQRAAW